MLSGIPILTPALSIMTGKAKQAYSICQIQPDPGFSDDNNYLKNAIAEAEHVDYHNGLEKQTVITPDGTDITEIVEKAVVWLTEHSF